MTVDRTEEERWREKQLRYRADDALEGTSGAPLKTAGGGGTSGGMEARLAKIEADVEHVKNDVAKLQDSGSDIKKTLSSIQVDIAKGIGEIQTGMATITSGLKHRPTRWEVFLTLTALIAAIGTIVAITLHFAP
jgi:hypothetical protein